MKKRAVKREFKKIRVVKKKNNLILWALFIAVIIALGFLVYFLVNQNQKVLFAPGDNLITNGDFESGVIPWSLNANQGDGSIEVKRIIASFDESDYGLVIKGYAFAWQQPAVWYNVGPNLEGRMFNLTFSARTSSPGNVNPAVAIQELPSWNAAYVFRPVLDTNMKRYSYVFTIPKNTDYILALGTDESRDKGKLFEVAFDDVSLVELFCTDSDGGKNYFVKGTTEGLNPEGVRVSLTDSCVKGIRTSLTEYFCDPSTDRVVSEIKDCGEGYTCHLGECILVDNDYKSSPIYIEAESGTTDSGEGLIVYSDSSAYNRAAVKHSVSGPKYLIYNVSNLVQESNYYIWVRQYATRTAKTVSIGRKTDAGSYQRVSNLAGVDVVSQWQWVKYARAEDSANFVFTKSDFYSTRGYLAVLWSDMPYDSTSPAMDALLFTSNPNYNPNNAKVINVTDSKLSGNYCTGQIKLECTMDGFSGSLDVHNNILNAELKGYDANVSANKVIAYFNYSIPASTTGNYDFGCYLNGLRADSDVSPVRPYPGISANIKTYTFSGCSITPYSCTSSVDCTGGKVCENNVCVTYDSPSPGGGRPTRCTESGRQYNIGERLTINSTSKYCWADGKWYAQKPANNRCINSYECLSNNCSGTGTSRVCVGTTIPICTSNCIGKECGSDGCGGSCGSCDSDEECTLNQCVEKREISVCGDGVCDASENSENCPEDCKKEDNLGVLFWTIFIIGLIVLIILLYFIWKVYEKRKYKPVYKPTTSSTFNQNRPPAGLNR